MEVFFFQMESKVILPYFRAVGSYLEALKDDAVKDVIVMVVEDEWGDLLAYGFVTCDPVEHTNRETEYRQQIRDKYPKVRSVQTHMYTNLICFSHNVHSLKLW